MNGCIKRALIDLIAIIKRAGRLNTCIERVLADLTAF